MFLILIIVLFIVGILYAYFGLKVRVKFKTFLKKGFKPNRGIFGVYCYCGKQGQGKTYSVVEFLHNNKDMPIYANLKSIRGLKYTYIANFNELLSLRDKTDCVIVYDEIFSALQKNSIINKDVLDFLSQMRKRRIICLTTAQEWAEIPLTWRRYCRYQIDCRLIRLPLLKGILIKSFKDAENMKWDNDEQEHVAPLIETTITHTQKWLANSYDTFEQISNRLTDQGLYSIDLGTENETDILNVPQTMENEETIELIEDIDEDFWGNDKPRKEDYEPNKKNKIETFIERIKRV